MKKVLLVILVIILIVCLGFGIKNLLDNNKANNETTEEEYLEKGWEIEAEYTYNGTISENELQYLQDDNSVSNEN